MSRNITTHWLAVLTCALFGATRFVQAQEIRGLVVNTDGATPASGVVVLLLHATRDDSIVARTLTGDRGIFSLRAPGATPVRLRVLRIGYQPMLIGTYTLAAGETKELRVLLTNERIKLATMDVKTDARCSVRPDSGLLVAQLYEEARKSLLSSTATVSGASSISRYTRFEREEDRRGKAIGDVKRYSMSGASLFPFASLSADSLAMYGYVVDDSDGVAYYAPDAEVLLSSSFLARHCLQLVKGTGAHVASIGIEFRPAKKQTKITDIRGTLWMNAATSELQGLEYTYDGISDENQRAGVGGTVEYTQMAGGQWFVSKWAIRMPQLSETFVEPVPGTRNLKIAVSGLQITGGEVESIRSGDDVLYLNASAVRVGGIHAEMMGLVTTAPLAAANSATAERVDTVEAVLSQCAAALSRDYPGQVRGHVLDGQRQPLSEALVRAAWQEDFQRAGAQFAFGSRNRTIETNSAEKGLFTLCGLPLSRIIQVSAKKNGLSSGVSTLRLRDSDPIAEVDLTIKTGSPPPPRRE